MEKTYKNWKNNLDEKNKALKTLRIAISYPPIINLLGQKAMVSQNRNVQYFKTPTYLLPVVQAQAATWLLEQGHMVYWDDGNSQLKTLDKWKKDLIAFKPDVILFESTTPVMSFYWKMTDSLKEILPDTVFVMSGYHSMRMPKETLENSKTDVVLKSNHADFAMRVLVNSIAVDPEWRNHLSQPGFTIRSKNGSFRDTGDFKQVEELEKSPFINRDLVQWKKYAYENGNFLRTPGTYATSVIRDCMFGKCTFCRYNGPEMTFSMMDVEKSLDEYQILVEKYHVKEIFDDSGVWYRGEDARRFARGIIERGLHKKGCYFGFNTRFEYLDEETIRLLGKANFRFILIGLESGHQTSLDRIDKGYETEHVEQTLKWMKKYGMHPHLTIMVGYYWETKEMLEATIKKVRSLMFRGLARTLQVTLCTPLDYTPYHRECIREGVLTAENYDDFDMSRLIVKTPLPHKEYSRAIRRMYGVAFHPLFILRQILFLFSFRLRDWQFIFTYGWRAIRRIRNHLFNLTVAGNKRI